jgi:hypothetical protein
MSDEKSFEAEYEVEVQGWRGKVHVFEHDGETDRPWWHVWIDVNTDEAGRPEKRLRSRDEATKLGLEVARSISTTLSFRKYGSEESATEEL